VADPVYNTLVWRRVRLEVLNRDGWRCRVGGPRCTGSASLVDHIVPWRQGGSWYDKQNLRASCRSCNTSRAYAGFETRRNPSREW
jgi:5-methylcytosine-specific restriction endonuclease McrA